MVDPSARLGRCDSRPPRRTSFRLAHMIFFIYYFFYLLRFLFTVLPRRLRLASLLHCPGLCWVCSNFQPIATVHHFQFWYRYWLEQRSPTATLHWPEKRSNKNIKNQTQCGNPEGGERASRIRSMKKKKVTVIIPSQCAKWWVLEHKLVLVKIFLNETQHDWSRLILMLSVSFHYVQFMIKYELVETRKHPQQEPSYRLIHELSKPWNHTNITGNLLSFFSNKSCQHVWNLFLIFMSLCQCSATMDTQRRRRLHSLTCNFDRLTGRLHAYQSLAAPTNSL